MAEFKISINNEINVDSYHTNESGIELNSILWRWVSLARCQQGGEGCMSGAESTRGRTDDVRGVNICIIEDSSTSPRTDNSNVRRRRNSVGEPCR